MKKNYGASFLNSIRDEMQQKRESQQRMNDSAIESGLNDMSNNTQQRNPTMNPTSNGTGSARPNFGQFAQDAIGGVMNGNKMGDALGFTNNMQQDPSMQNDIYNNNNGASISGVKPKKIAKAQAKAYADEHGIKGSSRKEMIKEAKRGRSFDPETNSQSKKVAESKKEVDFSGGK